MEMKEPTVWELMERKKAWDAKKAARKAEAERIAQEAEQASQEESATLAEILKAEDTHPGIPIEAKAEKAEVDVVPASNSGLTHISIALLDKYPNDPFREYTDQRLDQLVESIKEHGIISPITVRPKPEGRYEILSGRHRKNAADRLGMQEVPCIIKEVDDEEAAFIVTESNLKQREKLLPSEKAFAYKMQKNALDNKKKNHPKSDDISDNNNINQSLCLQDTNENTRRTIHRYIRLSLLIQELLDKVDIDKIAIAAAEQISYLNQNEQYAVFEYFFVYNHNHGVLDIEKAIDIRRFTQDKELTYSELDALMRKKKKPSKEKTPTMKLTRLVNHFPEKLTVKQMESIMIKAIDYWYEHAQEAEPE